MMVASKSPHDRYVNAISDSGLTIYDHVEIGDPNFWIPTPELEAILDTDLRNLSLTGLPLRTRSKRIKEHVCRALGYPVPRSFQKTQPRFPGQLFDTYVQKSNNLQIWNEDLVPTRRYVLIRIDSKDCIKRVKVVTGENLSSLDTTGTLTQKFQARCLVSEPGAELTVNNDTDQIAILTSNQVELSENSSPLDFPRQGELMSISLLFRRLRCIIGQCFLDTGFDQERNRGAKLQEIVCKSLGYKDFRDNGQFPDIRHQLLEVKLQTSPTIDLGLITPDSTDLLDVPSVDGYKIRHCDVRYAVFCAKFKKETVVLENLILVTGESFFTRFPQFQGKVLNKKLQIPLPKDFFLD